MTINIPTPIPALKMLSIAEQLENNRLVKLNTISLLITDFIVSIFLIKNPIY